MATNIFILALLLIHPPDTAFTIETTRIGDGFYVHTSRKILDGQIVPSNGLVAESEDGVIVVDTPWDTAQTSQLIDWIETHLRKKVICCIVTHSHEDRIGGIDAMLRRGIRVISTPLTADHARANGISSPEPILPNDTLLTWNGLSCECFYPGKGHTDDNIVVWFPGQKILFGGCLVKSSTAGNLGNTADADLAAWPASVLRVMAKFPDRQIVVPGHGSWKEKMGLEHTLDLLNRER
ncbi:MAG TPA: subclass B1 metallo-beta-lactamase [Bacteroidota bacterium]|nr:subclass B1 metallo-beta-lactamase [Bacteroidota bacterium]